MKQKSIVRYNGHLSISVDRWLLFLTSIAGKACDIALLTGDKQSRPVFFWKYFGDSAECSAFGVVCPIEEEASYENQNWLSAKTDHCHHFGYSCWSVFPVVVL